MAIFEPSALVLAGTIGSIALSSAMAFIAVNFHLRRSRLPDAAKYEDIRERRIAEEQRLADLRAEARAVEQQIQDRDRLSAEAAVLQERIDAMRLELASLDAARAEIEDVKHQAAEEAGKLATLLQECKAAEEELVEKRGEIEDIARRFGPEQIEKLKAAVQALKDEKDTLESALPQLRVERDAALRILEEARGFTARKAVMEGEIESLQYKIPYLSEKIASLQIEISNLLAARSTHAQIADETGRLEARRNALAAEIEELLARQSDLDGVRSDVVTAQSSLGAVLNRHEDLEQEVVRLEARRERLIAETSGKTQDIAILLDDIRQFPACLAAPAIAARAAKPEAEALGIVAKYLKDSGLEYHDRTLKAFHTSLKINDHVQITVLAGVSGTGKSLLPRRYAEAMGIHFQQIAVEPRWDSPQDLLGFYNYIEQKYRATDLTRLLVHMDPYRSVPLEGEPQDRRDHMALVLLDEMNLARVEYYFSEFLSRLEVRPRMADADDESRRKNAMIPIDIRGYDKPLALFPAHNVLFAGTMNDDESTQALSDKVLDRGNVIQFAAPTTFELPQGRANPSLAGEAMPFSTWKGWVRKIDFLRDNMDEANQHIGKLANIMEKCGRPFGHRLRDGILSYAANYPRPVSGAHDIRLPIADQIELRILPKLRGLEINGHTEALADLQALIRNDLADGTLADRLDALVTRQTNGSGLFGWGGLRREGQ